MKVMGQHILPMAYELQSIAPESYVGALARTQPIEKVAFC